MGKIRTAILVYVISSWPFQAKDDQIKMSMMGTKDSKSQKGPKLLSVITRQKKPIQKAGRASSHDNLMTGTNSEATSNSADSVLVNQKIRKLEEAKVKRKELSDGGVDKTKPNDKVL